MYSDPPGEYYCFDAFENGPLSVEVGRDLRWLTFQNLIEQKTIAPGSDQRVYSLTDAGRAEYVRITQSRTSGQLRTIQEIATFVTSHRLSDILNRISQEYPYFAVGSAPLAPTGD